MSEVQKLIDASAEIRSILNDMRKKSEEHELVFASVGGVVGEDVSPPPLPPPRSLSERTFFCCCRVFMVIFLCNVCVVIIVMFGLIIDG